MREVMAIVRMNMMNKTKQALSDAGISSMTAKDVLGRGKGLVDTTVLNGAEKGYEEAIAQLGQSQRLIPKRLLVVVVPEKSENEAFHPSLVKEFFKLSFSPEFNLRNN